jgi:2-dehydro-3-deoxyphosphogluconate aldolase/(4S)-4-hydroxy-2-oxoglutarate aldolase
MAWAQGVHAVEVPVQGSLSLSALEATVEAARSTGRCIGAGTITDTDLVKSVAAAGAEFTVAPAFSSEVSQASLQYGMPHLPGVMSPADVQNAMSHGHQWVKLFPASVMGPSMIKALHGPFPELRIVATGGITGANANQYLDAGARAVALGAGFAHAASNNSFSSFANQSTHPGES